MLWIFGYKVSKIFHQY